MKKNVFAAVRKQQSSAAAEDYTELVADLIYEKKIARVCDIARAMDISHVTALRTIKRLENEGYLTRTKERTLDLTALGKKTAAFAKEKHQLLLKFLKRIGVPNQIAEVDVEGMEHFISKTTLKAIHDLCEKI